MTAVLICGGRDFADLEFFVDRFLRVHENMKFTKVITGGARGADTFGHQVAVELGIESVVRRAEWDKYGKSAGFRRNQSMLDQDRPDLVMAFPGGSGTADMIRRSLGARVPVWKSERIEFNSRIPKHAWLSNMATGFEFVDEDGCVWATAEHYYQSRKTEDETVRSRVQAATTPFEAKNIGGRIKLVEGWNPPPEEYGGLKEIAMQEALCYKYAEGSIAADKLLKTGEDYLVEYSPYGDTYWGKSGDVGFNRLGILLMAQRDYLRGFL